MGQAYRKLHDFDRAISSLKRALELDPRNATAHSALGSCYLMLGQSEEAIMSYHEALAVHPGEPITTELLKLALADAVEAQTRPSISLKHTMLFPALSQVAADELDKRVEEDEHRFFGKSLRVDESEGIDEPNGSTAKKKGKRGGKAIRGQASSRRGRQQSTSASVAPQWSESDLIALDSSQDMSLQQSSPANNAVPLPQTTSTYGYGTASARRNTRASTGQSIYGTPAANGTRQRGESEFESQGENAEQDDETEPSYAGSDMVD